MTEIALVISWFILIDQHDQLCWASEQKYNTVILAAQEETFSIVSLKSNIDSVL